MAVEISRTRILTCITLLYPRLDFGEKERRAETAAASRSHFGGRALTAFEAVMKTGVGPKDRPLLGWSNGSRVRLLEASGPSHHSMPASP